MTRHNNENGPLSAPTLNGPKTPPSRGEKTTKGDRMKTPGLNTKVADPPDTEQGTPAKTPPAFASLFPPCARRRRWLIVYRCPRCSGHHQGLAWTDRVAGLRRSGCGRLIWIVVARHYGGGR